MKIYKALQKLMQGAERALAISIILLLVVAGNLQAATAELHPAIPLYDEDGAHVLDSAKPYSPRKSCGNGDGGGCHDYEAITHAYHFEMGRDEASDDYGKKRGLPHFVSPGYFGGYNCMGGSNQDVLAKKDNASVGDFADKGSAGWIQRCNGCHMGGGWMEKDRNGTRYDEKDPESVTYLDGDYFNRGTTTNNTMASIDTISQWNWKKSGVVEGDCMRCHGDFSNLKDGMAASALAGAYRSGLRGHDLASAGYFRYMGTAIFGFLNMQPASVEIPDSSAVLFNRDDSGHLVLGEDGQPVLTWNASVFDENRQLTIPMLRFPENDNCMACHLTSNSRRGFYGFGDSAFIDYSSDGTMIEDYQDDIHKGKNWTENGVTRLIDNCSSCHGRHYFRSNEANTDLDADHNFLKGNGDMDVRNDLDYNPNAKSCEYCHDRAANRPTYGGYSSMQSVHLDIWRFNGDMSGYPTDTLDRITKTHLDVVSCQACHITDKISRGRAIQIMYRYRRGEDGLLKISPYNPRIRYYWKDKNSGRILVQTERNAVFVQSKDESGNTIGIITDPMTGTEYGTVTARISHGSLRFGDPGDYAGFVGLKKAYDSLLKLKGVTNPDTALVWTESNQYVISHNTRPGVSSVQCSECHPYKGDGTTISALISTDGLLGAGNVKTVTQLVDKRLVDEGIVLFDLPYMKVDEAGKVTENVSDVLYASKINPSMTRFNAEIATAAELEAREIGDAEAFGTSGIYNMDEVSALKASYLTVTDVFLFKPNYGDEAVRKIAIIAEQFNDGGLSDFIFSSARMEIAISDETISNSASDAGFGGLLAEVYSIDLLNSQGDDITTFNNEYIVIKLPYRGTNTNKEEVKILTSADGSTWSAIDSSQIVAIQPASELDGPGYVLFATNHLSYYTVADSTVEAASGASTLSGGSSSGGKGFCFIATAAYGSYEEGHVQVLRDFRDQILLTNAPGTAFVDFYYKHSPPMADWIAKHETMRSIVRVLLWPLFAVAYFLVKMNMVQQLVFTLLFLSAASAGLSLYRKKAGLY
ncbi:MAG: cytochrome C [Deltaproteobacteria bacterium]|nr:cytochrome C [Deltaproteobacteria bacterium]